jgi:hypothetical protein
MELTQINNMGVSGFTDMQIGKPKSVNSVASNIINKPLEVDNTELIGKSQSTFGSSLVDNISKISKLQISQPEISKQIDIVNKIETLTQEMTTNPPKGKVLDDIQPEIQSLMNNFNTSSKAIAETLDNVANLNNEVKSRMYFDGILGSIPLSGKEIFEAVTAQRERLEQNSKDVEDQIKTTMNASKNAISREKEVVETKPVVKNIDFETESTKFDSQSIKNFEGSVVETQANAQTEQNIKLLAS